MCYFFDNRFLMDYSSYYFEDILLLVHTIHSGDSHTRKDEQNHEDMRYSLVKSQMTI